MPPNKPLRHGQHPQRTQGLEDLLEAKSLPELLMVMRGIQKTHLLVTSAELEAFEKRRDEMVTKQAKEKLSPPEEDIRAQCQALIEEIGREIKADFH